MFVGKLNIFRFPNAIQRGHVFMIILFIVNSAELLSAYILKVTNKTRGTSSFVEVVVSWICKFHIPWTSHPSFSQASTAAATDIRRWGDRSSVETSLASLPMSTARSYPQRLVESGSESSAQCQLDDHTLRSRYKIISRVWSLCDTMKWTKSS